MKKIIMFGVAICAACVVQAASFSWNASGNGTDGSGAVITDSSSAATVVLCYLGTTADYENAKVVQTGSWTLATNKKTGTATAKVQGTYYGDNAANGGSFANGQIYAVMVQDSEGGLHQIDGVGPYTVSGYSGTTWAGSTYNFASSNFVADKASYPAGGVPEPTSGLLLLIGGAMIALRRKQK